MLKVSVALAAAQGLLSIGARETAGAPTARGRALPQPGGWDPGLRSRLAASAFPDSPNYFESCPDSPDRRCHGSLAPGSGFYTLGGGSTNSSCKINGGAAARWSPNEGNPNVPCPFKFAWREDPSGGVIASAEVDSRSFLSGMTPNLYVGLQENIVVPPVYGGLSVQNSTMCPPLADVAAIAFKMRATLCFGVLKPGGFGRVSFYFTYWNLAKKVGRGISVDIFTFLYQPRTPSMPIRRPGKPFMDDGNALHLDGAAFGLVPNLTEPLVDRTPDCSLPIEHAPWVEVRVDVPSLLSKLLKMGVVEEEILAGAVLTGAIGANKRLLILLLKYQDRHRIAIR